MIPKIHKLIGLLDKLKEDDSYPVDYVLKKTGIASKRSLAVQISDLTKREKIKGIRIKFGKVERYAR